MNARTAASQTIAELVATNRCTRLATLAALVDSLHLQGYRDDGEHWTAFDGSIVRFRKDQRGGYEVTCGQRYYGAMARPVRFVLRLAYNARIWCPS